MLSDPSPALSPVRGVTWVPSALPILVSLIKKKTNQLFNVAHAPPPAQARPGQARASRRPGRLCGPRTPSRSRQGLQRLLELSGPTAQAPPVTPPLPESRRGTQWAGLPPTNERSAPEAGSERRAAFGGRHSACADARLTCRPARRKRGSFSFPARRKRHGLSLPRNRKPSCASRSSSSDGGAGWRWVAAPPPPPAAVSEGPPGWVSSCRGRWRGGGLAAARAPVRSRRRGVPVGLGGLRGSVSRCPWVGSGEAGRAAARGPCPHPLPGACRSRAGV